MREAKNKTAETEPVMETELSIEEIFDQLEEVIGQLMNGDISLEDSFKYYESGMKMVKHCGEKIDKVEKQIIVLNEGNAET
ncbi:MAG: exodeoxyribonuclease VII small subunit [Clostridium sp.]